MDIDLLTKMQINKLDLAGKIYDYVRLVDPISKKERYESKALGVMQPVEDQDCFALWNNKQACENCVAMRAWHENRTVVKIAYDKTKVYLAIAAPVQFDNARLVVELVKDVTKDGFITVEGQEIGDIEKLIQQKDSAVIRDAFTRVYNKNYIYERLPVDINISKEYNRPLALFYLSLKNLGRINDLYGYEAGNQIIKAFGNSVKRCCRKNTDWSSRYSGLEFIYVTFDMDEKKAHRKCKYFYDKISKMKFGHADRPIEVVFSTGYHMIQGDSITPDEFISAANRNIYAGEMGPDEGKIDIPERELTQKYLLTGRENDVALLVLRGLTNKEIAQKLYIGIPTVKKHVSNILKKVQVRSRTEFIARFKVGYSNIIKK